MNKTMMSRVMEVVKVTVHDMLEQEWSEYNAWVTMTYPTMEKNVITEATYELSLEEMDKCAEQVMSLEECRIGELGLRIIQEKIYYDEEMLISGCPIEEYAAIGVLRAWLREYEDCEIKSVKFRMDGTWETFEEDITIQ